jgi:hypothetical protein
VDCLWLSGKSKKYRGIGKRIRAFQPSRSLSTLMNKVITHPYFEYIEAMIKTESDCMSLHRTSDYDERIKFWMMLGGDDEQNTTLTALSEMKIFENRVSGFNYELLKIGFQDYSNNLSISFSSEIYFQIKAITTTQITIE